MAEGKTLQDLSQLNGKINKMSEDALRARLQELGLPTAGSAEVLKRRLKEHTKKDFVHLLPKNKRSEKGNFDYICVLDFEATCEKDVRDFPHEIIELPVVLVDTARREIVDEFRMHVRPVLNPMLSDFCIELTGITQASVDATYDFPTVLQQLQAWLDKHELFTKHTCAFATDGPWDFREFMTIQCHISGIKRPEWSRAWINVRRWFSAKYSQRGNLAYMLGVLGMHFEGRQHCGLDDTRNIARIVLQLLADGAVLTSNDALANYDLGAHNRFREHDQHRLPHLQRGADRSAPAAAASTAALPPSSAAAAAGGRLS